jgi:dipeptidase
MAYMLWGATGLNIYLGVSCDCWIAMRDATKDGSVILAKNSDRPSAESQPLVCFSRRHHQQGETVKCTYIEIPQSPVTYEHIGSKIWWTFGYEHGMNEHGVAIGNEAVWSKEPLEGRNGLLGMDLVRLGLERGNTGHEAMHVIIRLLETYGQCGNCLHKSDGTGAALTGFLTSAMMITSCSGCYRNTRQSV